MTRNKLKWLTLLMVVVIVGISASALLIPRPEGADETIFYSPTGMPVTLAESLFGVGSALLFFLAHKRFKAEIKPAYWLLAFGTFASGLLTLIIPYIEYNGLWGNQIFVTISYMPYFLIAVFMYLGVRKFYKTLGFGGLASHIPLILIITLAAWVLYNFIPHTDTWADLPSEWQYNLMQLLTVTPAIAINAALFMAIKALRKTGSDYHRPFAWLVIGIGFEAIALTTATVLQITGYDNWYFNSRAYETPYILATMSYLIAGYYFLGIGLPYARRIDSATITSVDLITYLASKVSDPNKIDPYLDKMRVITAQLEPGEALNEEEEMILQTVYEDIEKFLVTSDQLRTFSSTGLRKEVAEHFNLAVNADKTFWPKLKP